MTRTLYLFLAGALGGALLTGGVAHATTAYRQYQATAACAVTSGSLSFNSGDGTLRNFSVGSTATLLCPFVEGDNFDKGHVSELKVNFNNGNNSAGTAIAMCVAYQSSVGGTCDSASTYTTLGDQSPAITPNALGVWAGGSYTNAYPYISITLPTKADHASFVRGYRVTTST